MEVEVLVDGFGAVIAAEAGANSDILVAQMTNLIEYYTIEGKWADQTRTSILVVSYV